MNSYQTWQTIHAANYWWMEVPCEVEIWHIYLDIS